MDLSRATDIHSLIETLRTERDRLEVVRKGEYAIACFETAARIAAMITVIDEIVSHLKEKSYEYQINGMFAVIPALRKRMLDQVRLVALSDNQWMGVQHSTTFDIVISSVKENEEKVFILHTNGRDIEVMPDAFTLSDTEWKEKIDALYSEKKRELAQNDEAREKQRRFEYYLALKKEFEQ